MEIFRTKAYAKALKRMKASEADVDRLENEITSDPLAGDIIQGLGGVRKIRFRIGNRGKSSGGRAIYYAVVTPERVFMLTAYAKADKDDLSPADRKALRMLMTEIEKHLENEEGS